MNNQKLLDNAPEGATHYSAGLDQYWDWPTRTIKPVDNTLLEDVNYPDDLRSLSDIKRITELEIICAAVAHVGVDFGYGKFEITNELIEKARLLTAPPEKGQ